MSAAAQGRNTPYAFDQTQHKYIIRTEPKWHPAKGNLKLFIEN
jgi:hypothetical protein